MSGTPDRAHLLAGGYATRTLTPEERRELLEAALEDDGVFAELVDEQPLYELLDDRGLRAELAAALQPQPRPSWLRWQLLVPVAAAAVAVAVGATLLTRGGAAVPFDLLGAVAAAEVSDGGSQLQVLPAAPEISSKSLEAPAPSRGIDVRIAPAQGGDVVLVGMADDGTPVPVFPSRIAAAEHIPPGGEVHVTSLPAGRRLVSVRLLVLPSGVDVHDAAAVRQAFEHHRVTVLETRLP